MPPRADTIHYSEAARRRYGANWTPKTSGPKFSYGGLRLVCPGCNSTRWRNVGRWYRQDPVYRYKQYHVVVHRCSDCGWYGQGLVIQWENGKTNA